MAALVLDASTREQLFEMTRDPEIAACSSADTAGRRRCSLLQPVGASAKRGRREVIQGLTDLPLAGLSAAVHVQAGLPDEDDAARMAGELGPALV